jgi:hypothetical protein
MIPRYTANAVVAHTVVSVCLMHTADVSVLAAAISCAYVYSLRVHASVFCICNLTAP